MIDPVFDDMLARAKPELDILFPGWTVEYRRQQMFRDIAIRTNAFPVLLSKIPREGEVMGFSSVDSHEPRDWIYLGNFIFFLEGRT